MDHLVHGPVPELAPVDLGDFTKAAVIGAPPGGLGGDVPDLVTLEIQQVIAGHRQVFQVRQFLRLIAGLKPPGLEIPEEPGPGLLGLPQHQGIGMFLAFIRGQGGVETAHHHGDTPAAETRGQLKGPGGLVGHEGEAHQVAVFPEGDLLQHVVLDLHLDVLGVKAATYGRVMPSSQRLLRRSRRPFSR